MNLPPEIYDHPVVRECLADASRRIEAWSVTQHPTCIRAKELLTSGWDGLALLEMVVEPLLELRGITADDARPLQGLQRCRPERKHRRRAARG